MAQAQTAPDIEAASAAPAASQPLSVLHFRFTGSGFEYFRIWIVNILLSIITLGVYSAWAKVRNKRYFYGNTLLEKASFDYLADPRKILKGRLIVVGFFGVYALVGQLSSAGEALFALVLLPLLIPWAATTAVRFNNRNSDFRNVTFDFRGRYGEAFFVYVVLTALSLLTLGLLYPYAAFRRKKFVIENSSYGNSEFAFEGTPQRFYAIYLSAAAMALALLILPWVLLGAGAFPAQAADAEQSPAGALAPGAAAPLIAGLGLFAAVVYARTRVASYTWGSTRLGETRFHLALEYPRMLWLTLSNVLAIVASVGLLVPWAKVRMARYKVERLSLATSESLERFTGEARREREATGEEFGDALDLDLGL